MTDRTVAYSVRMTPAESDALERVRIALGARSHAEAVRRLIAKARGKIVDVSPVQFVESDQ